MGYKIYEQGTNPDFDPTDISPYGHNNPQHITDDELATLTLDDYNLTPESIKAYLFGVKVIDPDTNAEMGDAFYESIIQAALSKAEQTFDIAIFPRWIKNEHHDFYENDANSYMYQKLFKRPVIQAKDFYMEFSGKPLIRYDPSWWRVYNLPADIEVYPTPIMQAGMMSHYDFNNTLMVGQPQMSQVFGVPMTNTADFAPQAFDLTYLAGLLPRKNANYSYDWEMPADLEQLIIKYALKELLEVWGKLIIGAGIAAKKLSMDGISEEITTTQSAMYTGSAADIAQIDGDIDKLETRLKSYFGISWGVV